MSLIREWFGERFAAGREGGGADEGAASRPEGAPQADAAEAGIRPAEEAPAAAECAPEPGRTEADGEARREAARLILAIERLGYWVFLQNGRPCARYLCCSDPPAEAGPLLAELEAKEEAVVEALRARPVPKAGDRAVLPGRTAAEIVRVDFPEQAELLLPDGRRAWVLPAPGIMKPVAVAADGLVVWRVNLPPEAFGLTPKAEGEDADAPAWDGPLEEGVV